MRIARFEHIRPGKFMVAGAILAVLVILWGARLARAPQLPLRTVPMARGDLEVSISATGTLEPEELVDIGAQVAGKIREFGTDAKGKTIDYGAEVEEGMVLAQIDDSLYAADVAQAKSALARAHAELLQARAKLEQAKNDWKRVQSVGADALAATSLDAYKATYESAEASIAVGQAGVEQADAALKRSEQNLGYTTIRSPVKGVIIDRRVNIGQTVVSSLNAPSLFLIAKDLRKMQIWVAVNEADIGSIHPGQKVTFTVDAFPGDQFTGEVGKVRLNASMTQNVVTYTVEVHTDNSAGKLLPYLTANVRFQVTDQKNVLLVPNTALRWSPSAELLGKEEAPPAESAPQNSSKEESAAGLVWTYDGTKLEPHKVSVSGSDGHMSEIVGSDIEEGAPIVIGEVETVPGNEKGGQVTQSKNPFAPTVFRGRRGR